MGALPRISEGLGNTTGLHARLTKRAVNQLSLTAPREGATNSLAGKLMPVFYHQDSEQFGILSVNYQFPMGYGELVKSSRKELPKVLCTLWLF